MIKPKELRIGNWIFDTIGRPVRVSEIREETYIFKLSNGSKLKHHLKKSTPIPLTTEWLKRFGFDSQMSGTKWILTLNTYEMDCRALVFSGDYLYLWEMDEDTNDLMVLWNKDIMKNWYVHQLQNLYFALTGKEL